MLDIHAKDIANTTINVLKKENRVESWLSQFDSTHLNPKENILDEAAILVYSQLRQEQATKKD